MLFEAVDTGMQHFQGMLSNGDECIGGQRENSLSQIRNNLSGYNKRNRILNH